MAYDASIILQGQPVNALGAMQAGNTVAQQSMDIGRQNALAGLYKEQGAGILNGDQNALNALAREDPGLAMGFKQSQQGLAFDAEKMQMVRDEAKRNIAEHAAKMSAEERANAAAVIERGVAMATQAQNDQQWDQIVTQAGAPELVGRFGDKDTIIAGYLGVKDALAKAAAERKAAQEAAAGPEWRPATPEEAKAQGAVAGQINTRTGKFDPQNPPSGMKVESDGRGGFSIVQGPGASQTPSGGAAVSSPEAMIASIDGILNDPALDYSTGILALGQKIPGTPMKRFEGRANQLNGQAFLQAFQSLKGGGQITEIEGAKATQAIGRLDTAQSPEDYRAALTELRDILTLAQQRPVGWVYGQADPSLKQGNQPAVGDIENGYRFKGGNAADAANWEAVQ